MYSTHKLGAKVFALAAAAAVTTGGIAFAAAPAFAAPGDGGDGTITVTKYEQPDGNLGANDGGQLTSISGSPVPIAGSTFTVCQVTGVDLTNAADWDKLAGVSLAPNGTLEPTMPTGLGLTDCADMDPTNANGVSTGTYDADQAYVVYESVLPTGSTGPAQPALVTLPYPKADGSGWATDVYLYPKNTLAGEGATKTSTVLGDEIIYTLKENLEPLAVGATYTEFGFTDALQTSLLYTSLSVVMFDEDGDEFPLASGDYTQSTPPASTSTTGGQTVTWDLTASGLAKVNDPDNGLVGGASHIEATLTTRALSGTSGANTVSYRLNGASSNVSDPAPKTVVGGQYLLDLARNRGVAESPTYDGYVTLAAAKFDVWQMGAGTTVCPTTEPTAATANVDSTTAGSGDVVGEVISAWTAGSDGKTPTEILAEGVYCAYETTVPAGYKGDPNGELLTVTASSDLLATIVNTQIGADSGDLPALPVTGGSGSVMLMTAGGALVLLGIVLFVVSRRRHAREAADAVQS